MHILFISEYFPPQTKGGGEINLQILATALAVQGHTISLLTSQFPDLLSYEEKERVKIYRRLKTGQNPASPGSNVIRSFFFPRSVVQETRKIVSEINPDIIHFIGTSIITAPKLKFLSKPLFATIESYPTLCPKGDRWYHGKEECKIVCSFKEFASCQRDSEEIGKMKNKWYLKYNPLFLGHIYNYYKRSNKALSYCTLISISKYVQQLLLLHNQQSTVIPNILETETFPLAKKKIKEDKKVQILYLGSLIKSKGPQILLEALKGIDCHCDLYGEGNLKPELQEYIERNNLDAEIHLPVPYEKVPELYAQADIVVFPSLWPEPFGRIAIEAMAAGKTIIASDIGAIPETIEKNGILVPSRDSNELHQAIMKAISMKPGTAINSVSQYEPSTIVTQLIQVYEAL